MKTYGQIQMIPLEEALPNRDIFASMSGLSFIPDATVASYLDLEYFLNRSGRKVASPLVLRIDDENDYVITLASIITNRYKPKWEQLFARYSDISTLNLLDNINVTRETEYGKTVEWDSSGSITKSGTETQTQRGVETHTETINPNNPRKSERSITGKYTDTENTTSTRSGSQAVTESFPETRKSSKVTTGGYTDTDTITNTRSGSQKVTDKGGTLSSTYGFNSSTPVPTQVVAPEDSLLGTTQETTYGTDGLIDAHSGSVARTYNEEGLKEETTESGQRKTETTFGQAGLQDKVSGGTTRSYENYKDSVTESGAKSLEISYGENGITNETGFNNRIDDTESSGSKSWTGTDTITETGFKYRRDELLQQYLALFSSANMIDFLEIIYEDVDNVLTLPIFV